MSLRGVITIRPVYLMIVPLKRVVTGEASQGSKAWRKFKKIKNLSKVPLMGPEELN